jgi:hypothetical protein
MLEPPVIRIAELPLGREREAEDEVGMPDELGPMRRSGVRMLAPSRGEDLALPVNEDALLDGLPAPFEILIDPEGRTKPGVVERPLDFCGLTRPPERWVGVRWNAPLELELDPRTALPDDVLGDAPFEMPPRLPPRVLPKKDGALPAPDPGEPREIDERLPPRIVAEPLREGPEDRKLGDLDRVWVAGARRNPLELRAAFGCEREALDFETLELEDRFGRPPAMA